MKPPPRTKEDSCAPAENAVVNSKHERKKNVLRPRWYRLKYCDELVLAEKQHGA